MESGSRKLILIAVGNPLRGDDGVAQHVLKQLGPGEYEARTVLQLTPELAEDIAGYETVVFLDADPRASCVSIEPAPDPGGNSRLTHAASAAETIALARGLYGFAGRAFLCRIPASDFSPGQALSAVSETAAAQAAHRLSRLGLPAFGR